MHGRPREYKKKLEDPVFQEGYKKKVDAIRKGTALILECRKSKRYDSVALDASAKLLKVVPEVGGPLITTTLPCILSHPFSLHADLHNMELQERSTQLRL